MTDEKQIFKPLKIKNVSFKNRLWVSPMCQYSSQEGHPTDWHFVHLGSRAVGGAGLVRCRFHGARVFTRTVLSDESRPRV